MALFDFLSGSDEAEQAAAANRAALQGYGTNLNNIYGTYQTGSLNALGSARDAALAALTGGYGAAGDTLRTGLDKSAAAGQGAINAYGTLSDLGKSYQPAIDAYYGSLGIGGPAARTAAENAFTASPGYQYQVDQAIKQINNNAAARGAFGSGNTARALTEDVRNRALSDYGNWQTRLAGFLPLQASAVSGAAAGTAGGYKNLADIYGQGYTGIAGLQTAGGSAQAGLETGYGSDVSNVLGNVAGGQAQTARDVVQGNIAANNQIAQAGQQDAANYWGLIGAGVKAAGSAYGGGGSGRV